MSEDISGTYVDASESTISLSDISGAYMMDLSGTPVPPPTISLADILNASEVLKHKEDADKAALEGIGAITFDSLRASLIRWATAGFPNAYPVYEINIRVPDTCLDGVTRGLHDYIVYLTTKTIHDLVAGLQERLVDIVASFAYSGYSIQIVVSKQ
jgi:hypothetical protein